MANSLHAHRTESEFLKTKFFPKNLLDQKDLRILWTFGTLRTSGTFTTSGTFRTSSTQLERRVAIPAPSVCLQGRENSGKLQGFVKILQDCRTLLFGKVS